MIFSRPLLPQVDVLRTTRAISETYWQYYSLAYNTIIALRNLYGYLKSG